MSNNSHNAEQRRLREDGRPDHPWRRWGPFLSERQWGTVREDYSAEGTPWTYFPFELARSRAYRWGEDGIAGICDAHQYLCLAPVCWNGRDPMIKERLFGLGNREGNHGEDVKEYYYYLDAVPSHAYLKALYKYPQREFPYAQLLEENRRRGKLEPEYELIDTGVFDDDRYFDLFVEYAKASPDDLLMRITVYNRGADAAELYLLPQLWFRNTWSWTAGADRPRFTCPDGSAVHASHRELGNYYWYVEPSPTWLFCDNDTNKAHAFGLAPTPGYFKDAFNDYLVHGRQDAVNPERSGSKVGALHHVDIPAGGMAVLRTRLTPTPRTAPFHDVDAVFEERRAEADAFYAALQEEQADADARNVQRQALAGMIWNKQFYHYDIPQWLQGDPLQPPPPPQRLYGRNADWLTLNNADVISMPDNWEFPWYATWDLCFHCITFALIDPEFAKEQLLLLMHEWYMAPSGQLPACEWNFSDVNPPLQAWAAWRVFQIDRKHAGGQGDFLFLERVFMKLLLNFTWWVNRKDAQGHNIFQGGVLGLDNIGVFDRSLPLSNGEHLDQSDSTGFMAMFALTMLRISLELALHNRAYEDMATKFFEHFLYIARAMTDIGSAGLGLWDEQEEFYFDMLELPDHRMVPLKVRSMVGLIPMCAVETLEPEMLEKLPAFTAHMEWFLHARPDLAALISEWTVPGRGKRRLLSLLRGHRLKLLLRHMLDEQGFFSAYGVRSLSRYYLEHPYVFWQQGTPITVKYAPGEGESDQSGGNSNWRGPIWFPPNYLLIESLQRFYHYYTDDFKVECPSGSGHLVTINQIAQELTRRLTSIFLRDEQGRRPVFGATEKFQQDAHFRDYLLFYEYFHGDNGRGCGASHQTGWTGLIAKLLQPRKEIEPE